jgi:hypothetical protein
MYTKKKKEIYKFKYIVFEIYILSIRFHTQNFCREYQLSRVKESDPNIFAYP